MATTVHAGPAWAAGLQSASNTMGTARKAKLQEREQQRRESLTEADIRRVEAITEATQLEGEMLEAGRQKAIEQARLEHLLFQESLDPTNLAEQSDELGPEKFAEIWKDASPEQLQRIRAGVEQGRSIMAEVEGQRSLLYQMQEYAGAGAESAAPGTEEELGQLYEALLEADPSTSPGVIEGFREQFESLRARNTAHRAKVRFTQRALARFDAEFGTVDDPNMDLLREQLADAPEESIAIFSSANALKNPKEHEYTLQKHREELQADLEYKVLGIAADLVKSENYDTIEEAIVAAHRGLQKIRGGGSEESDGPSDAEIDALLDQGLSEEEILKRLGGE